MLVATGFERQVLNKVVNEFSTQYAEGGTKAESGEFDYYLAEASVEPCYKDCPDYTPECEMVSWCPEFPPNDDYEIPTVSNTGKETSC